MGATAAARSEPEASPPEGGERVARLQLGDVRIEGRSRAGTETWFRIHPPGLAFDAGRGAPPLAGAADLFLTHGHLDHALGVPYVLSQRSLHRDRGTRLFCPAEIVADLEALILAAERLERADYHYELVGLEPGDRVRVGRDLAVEAFASDHVVPSLGFSLLRTRRRLRPEHRGLPGETLRDMRERGEEVTDSVEDHLLAYCGDTGPAVLDREPELLTARILMIECTFLDEEHRRRGERYKHVHLEDLVERADRFANEHLVLFHLSRRHRPEELLRAAERKLGAELARRVHVLA